MKVLLIQPEFSYVKHPPLGLLKLATWHRNQSNEIFYQDLNRPEDWQEPPWQPDQIDISSLWTWDWQNIHITIRRYQSKYPKAHIRLGGIYASLMPEHAKKSGANEIVTKWSKELDQLMPAYDLVSHYWNKSIIFTSRGCPNNCHFCAVPRLEGGFQIVHESLKHLIYPDHKEVIILDNNLLAGQHHKEILQQLIDLNLRVDFNQGLDFKLINQDNAELLMKIKKTSNLIHTALDKVSEIDDFKRGSDIMLDIGFRRKSIIVYLLYNFQETPDEFLMRLKFCLENEFVVYPMRYQPLKGKYALIKDSFISKHWNPKLLEMIASTRRKVGTHGAIIPNELTKKLMLPAKTLEEAMTPFPVGMFDPRQTKLID